MSDVSFKKLSKEMAGTQRSGSSMLLLTVITLIGIIIFWSAVTEIDNVVRGSGKTVSEAKNQFVQSSEPGVIRTRYVSDGDIVNKGQLLFDIDPVDAKAQLDQAQKRFSSLKIFICDNTSEFEITSSSLSKIFAPSVRYSLSVFYLKPSLLNRNLLLLVETYKNLYLYLLL